MTGMISGCAEVTGHDWLVDRRIGGAKAGEWFEQQLKENPDLPDDVKSLTPQRGAFSWMMMRHLTNRLINT
jgi:hypothetical protein